MVIDCVRLSSDWRRATSVEIAGRSANFSDAPFRFLAQELWRIRQVTAYRNPISKRLCYPFRVGSRRFSQSIMGYNFRLWLI